ncbi:alpha/beta hydrolase fold domain-containing protein [Herbiconiux sp. L3-i23]|uniref:alpha/beta hydrolase fold domain-containing protein n=1 Tax=Herbiconiux sp. L3-i23 TaxID=2905871 RepID=UPI00206980EF|nr:alpha/beta hydrolase [Herbiconiux sp. L3-i23]BDI23524.1 alpha/beta hydrolase [Herbiconiux sp. L3-i23]
MVAVPEALVPAYLRLTRANRTYITADGARRRVRERALRPASYGPPARLRPDIRVEVGERLGRPVYTIGPTKSPARGGLVYLHGGGWVGEIVLQHWQLVAQLAAESNVSVSVPIYALVPFGTADDALALTTALALDAGEQHGRVILAGDSAGGQIALSAAQHLRDQHGVTAALTTLIAPALDLSWSNPRIPVVQPTDPWLGTPGGRVLSEHWRGERDIRDPVVSPLFGDMRGLGPLSVFTGSRDVLNPDAHLLREKVVDAGGEIAFHEEIGQLHNFPLLPTRMGERGRAEMVREIVAALPG